MALCPEYGGAGRKGRRYLVACRTCAGAGEVSQVRHGSPNVVQGHALPATGSDEQFTREGGRLPNPWDALFDERDCQLD